MQNRRNGRQLMLVGVVVIILVLGVGYFVTSRGSSGSSASAKQPTGMLPIVMANQVIPQGTVFKAGQDFNPLFTVKQVPVALAPFGAYSSVSQIASLTKSQGCGPVQAAGCQGQITTSQTIFQNTPVVTGMFSTLGQYRSGVGPAFAIPYGYVGIAVNFDLVNSVLGSVNPGDDVDLIASYHGTHIAGLKAPPQTQYVLNDLRVISVNGPPAATGSSTAPTSSSAQTTSSSSSSSSSSTSPNTSSQNSGGTLVLLVRFQQALVIQHLKDFGWQMSVVLRSNTETDIPHFKTLPVTDKWFFAKTDNPLKSDPGY